MVTKLLNLARKELGVREYPPNSNKVKYNTAYYGQVVSGSNLAWCAVFVWWLFRECGMSELYYGGKKTAYVPALISWARREGLVVKTPRPGDLICFDFNGNGTADHIGICESFDGSQVTTIDGNTGVGNEANGGAVMRRKRAKRYIAAVIRPKYEEVNEVTQEQFDKMMDNYLARKAKEGASPWAADTMKQAKVKGIMDGSRPKAFATREECAAMILNAQK